MSVAKTPRGASLLNRYLLREVGQTWLAVTLVLLLILITNQFAAVLGDAAASQIPRDAIVRVMALTIVQYLTILVPLSFFLAIMLSLARLYHDSEMAAMMAWVGHISMQRVQDPQCSCRGASTGSGRFT